MTMFNRVLWGVGAAVMWAAPVLAQSDTAPTNAISLIGGAGSSASTTGIALGGSMLFDLTDRYSVEVQATYLDRGRAADAFNATGSFLVNLMPSDSRIVPYAAAGGGLHRASFDLASPRFFGPVGTQFAPGTVVCPAPGTGVGFGPGSGFGPGDCTGPESGGYWGVGQLNRFYAQRLGPMMVPANADWDRRSFVDPALTLGGGVRFNVTDHVMIRPDMRALTLFADGDTHIMGVFVVHLGYRF
jgi:hypothetical protein